MDIIKYIHIQISSQKRKIIPRPYFQSPAPPFPSSTILPCRLLWMPCVVATMVR